MSKACAILSYTVSLPHAAGQQRRWAASGNPAPQGGVDNATHPRCPCAPPSREFQNACPFSASLRILFWFLGVSAALAVRCFDLRFHETKRLVGRFIASSYQERCGRLLFFPLCPLPLHLRSYRAGPSASTSAIERVVAVPEAAAGIAGSRRCVWRKRGAQLVEHLTTTSRSRRRSNASRRLASEGFLPSVMIGSTTRAQLLRLRQRGVDEPRGAAASSPCCGTSPGDGCWCG